MSAASRSIEGKNRKNIQHLRFLRVNPNIPKLPAYSETLLTALLSCPTLIRFCFPSIAKCSPYLLAWAFIYRRGALLCLSEKPPGFYKLSRPLLVRFCREGDRKVSFHFALLNC
ncbi:hypothetical protein AAG906_000022 [Vitis piasezkii]